MIQGLNSPRQSRSKRTLEKILDASERLLENRSFEEISVADIVREAACSNGSFYARFGEKSALLPALYQRYDAMIRQDMEAWFEQSSHPSLSLKELCDGCVDEIANMFSARIWLMRAVTIYSRTHADAIPPDSSQHRSEFLNRMVQVFLSKRDEMLHPDPQRAVRYGLFTIAATARDAILFGESPHAKTSELKLDTLKQELSHMFFTSLTQSM